jgi:hypothetical protein
MDAIRHERTGDRERLARLKRELREFRMRPIAVVARTLLRGSSDYTRFVVPEQSADVVALLTAAAELRAAASRHVEALRTAGIPARRWRSRWRSAAGSAPSA